MTVIKLVYVPYYIKLRMLKNMPFHHHITGNTFSTFEKSSRHHGLTLSSQTIQITASIVKVKYFGVDGNLTLQRFLQECYVIIDGFSISLSFLLTPDCPIILLGCDVLCTLGAHLTFREDGITMELPLQSGPHYLAAPCSTKDRRPRHPSSIYPAIDPLPDINPEVWAKVGSPALAIHAPMVCIKVKLG
ncbi:UNVERIFIED_CONTAM: hypothetical protein K2H54_063415 [Gekko kuhli]